MTTILFPMLVQIGLTLTILPFVGLRRVAQVAGDKALLKKTAVDVRAFPDASRKIANNFDNQFQLPVLFYVGCLFAYITGADSVATIGLAWTFVALRIIHTVIHTTYNHVGQRFTAFLFGAIALVAFLVTVFAHVLATGPVALPAGV